MKRFSLFFVLGLILLSGSVSAEYGDLHSEPDYNTWRPADDVPSFMTKYLNNERRLGVETSVNTVPGGVKTTDPLLPISSPVDFATLDEINSDPNDSAVAGIIALETNSEIERNRNYVKISSDLKSYEDAYKACLSAISDNDFSQETIEKCLGQEYQFVNDDIDYEKRKIQARADTALRTAMIRLCYNEAGADLVMDNACDLIERDALDLLWDEMNFHVLVDYHREKYIFVHAKLPEDLFSRIMERFKEIYGELEQLIEELYAHKDLTISRIKRDVDDRAAVIAEKFRQQADHPTPKIKKDIINIDETLIDHPNYYLDLDHLPRPMIENGEDQMYAMSNNPWVESFAHNIGPAHYASINSKYEVPEFDNPLRVLNGPSSNNSKRNLTRSSANANRFKQSLTNRNAKTISKLAMRTHRIQSKQTTRRAVQQLRVKSRVTPVRPISQSIYQTARNRQRFSRS